MAVNKQQYASDIQELHEFIDNKNDNRVYSKDTKFELQKAKGETLNEIMLLKDMIRKPLTSSKKHNKIIKKAVTEQIAEYEVLLVDLDIGAVSLYEFDNNLRVVDDRVSAVVTKAVMDSM